MNRREFVTALTASAWGGCVMVDANRRSACTAKKPRFHVFSKMFQSPVTKSPEELCELMAAAGYDGIQWTVRKGGHATPENVKTELPRLVNIAAARGLTVESICTSITDGNDPASELICRTAADCGIRRFRTGYYFYDEKKETLRVSLDRFKCAFDALADLSARTGVKATYQNHSTCGVSSFFGSVVWDLCECLRDIDPRYVGIEFDPMHAQFETYESWRHGFARVAPWIAAIDLKDFHYQLSTKDPKRIAKKMVAAGAGVGPWSDTRRLMDAYKIDPFYILHFEYDFDKTNLQNTVATELNYFKRYFAKG